MKRGYYREEPSYGEVLLNYVSQAEIKREISNPKKRDF